MQVKKLITELQTFLSQEINALDEKSYAQLCDKKEKIKIQFESILTDYKKEEYMNEVIHIPIEDTNVPAYPNRYQAMPITDQIETLAEIAKISPKLALAYVRNTLCNLSLPDGAEGWFAILSRRYESTKSYFERIELLKKRLSRYRDINLETDKDIEELSYTTRTEVALTKIEQRQKGPILIIPAQFGKRHASMSADRARELFSTNEFGLDLLSLISMHITHPTRLPIGYDERKLEFTTHCCGNNFANFDTNTIVEIRNQTLHTEITDDYNIEHSHPTGFLINESIYN